MNELTIHADFTALDAMLRRLRKEERPVRIVHDGVEYGVYQEFGTTKLTPRPAAQTAAAEIEPAYQTLMGQSPSTGPGAAEEDARDAEARWKGQIVAMRIIDTGSTWLGAREHAEMG